MQRMATCKQAAGTFEELCAAHPVAYQVIEDAQAFGILALLYLQHRAQLCAGEGYVFPIQDDLQLLAPDTVRLWPHVVIFLHNLRAGK